MNTYDSVAEADADRAQQHQIAKLIEKHRATITPTEKRKVKEMLE